MYTNVFLHQDLTRKNLLLTFIYLFYLFIMLFEAGEPASKVCGQPVPTARNVQLYINYN